MWLENLDGAQKFQFITYNMLQNLGIHWSLKYCSLIMS